MKYLEQRVEELEKEVAILKDLNQLKNTSSWKSDYMYNHSNMTLLSESGLESSNCHFWDSSELEKNPLDTVTLNLSSIDLPPDLPEYMPPYPNIIGSWDNFDFDRVSKDWISFNQKDNIPPYEGHEKIASEYFCESEKKIENDFGKIISRFKILHHQWEMDGYGYIIQTDEGKKIVTTDHGKPVIVDKYFLEIRIKEYKEAIQETQRALFLIK
jgi:hypothetical protein